MGFGSIVRMILILEDIMSILKRIKFFTDSGAVLNKDMEIVYANNGFINNYIYI